MVLTDDNFPTILRSVKEAAPSTTTSSNSCFQLSTNMDAIQTVLGTRLLGWATPFTAIQILWVNIIMGGPSAIHLGVEPTRAGVMLWRRPAGDRGAIA